METYIVRIYRRHSTASIDGVVETVPEGTQAAFHEATALWQLLAGKPRRRKSLKSKPAPSPTAVANPAINKREG